MAAPIERSLRRLDGRLVALEGGGLVGAELAAPEFGGDPALLLRFARVGHAGVHALEALGLQGVRDRAVEVALGVPQLPQRCRVVGRQRVGLDAVDQRGLLVHRGVAGRVEGAARFVGRDAGLLRGMVVQLALHRVGARRRAAERGRERGQGDQGLLVHDVSFGC